MTTSDIISGIVLKSCQRIGDCKLGAVARDNDAAVLAAAPALSRAAAPLPVRPVDGVLDTSLLSSSLDESMKTALHPELDGLAQAARGAKKQLVSAVGPSGSGKSTLLRLFAQTWPTLLIEACADPGNRSAKSLSTDGLKRLQALVAEATARNRTSEQQQIELERLNALHSIDLFTRTCCMVAFFVAQGPSLVPPGRGYRFIAHSLCAFRAPLTRRLPCMGLNTVLL
jgi:hypothetical protein